MLKIQIEISDPNMTSMLNIVNARFYNLSYNISAQNISSLREIEILHNVVKHLDNEVKASHKAPESESLSS